MSTSVPTPPADEPLTAQAVKRPRSRTAVHFYLEDGFLVRGVTDPSAALALAVADDDNFEMKFPDCAIRNDDEEPHADSVRELGDLCHQLLKEARVGLFRIVPVAPDSWMADDGYAWVVSRPSKRGPGVFEGVEFP